jgi:probable blue pigment (indigoidine) exporter
LLANKSLLLGLIFTIFWSTGAIIMKIGLLSASPLTLGVIRFLIAGLLLLLYIYVIKKGTYRFPNKKEWKPLFLLGLLNTALYLGISFWALQTVSAGLFNLFVPINPFIVAFLVWIFMGESIQKKVWLGMILSSIGLFIATYPLIKESQSTVSGIIFLITAMICMAIGSIYYKKVNLQLSNLVINAWQVFIGGVILIIPTILLEAGNPIEFDKYFIAYLLWSIFGISITTMLIWFYLLKEDAVKANNWLFLTPIAGYGLSAFILGEAITIFDIIAVILVLLGLYFSGNLKVNIKREQSIQLSK